MSGREAHQQEEQRTNLARVELGERPYSLVACCSHFIWPSMATLRESMPALRSRTGDPDNRSVLVAESSWGFYL
jgi:hypothetical protein